jgi:hypothetical protein
MSTTLERIRNEARTLPLDEREALLTVLDFDLRGEHPAAGEDDAAAVEAAWDEEIGSRVAEIEAGKVALLTHEQFMSVFDEAREELHRRKANA